MYKVIIFDLDGVIIDSEYHYLLEIEYFLKKIYNFTNFSIKDLYQLVGVSWSKHYYLLSKLIEFEKSPKQIQQEFNTYEKSLKREYDSWLFKDAKKVLTQLKSEGYTLALASNSQEYKINEVIHENNLQHFFSLIVSGDQFKEGKPSPEIYNYVLQKLESKPEETIIVEDSEAGITAGKKANCKVIAVYDNRFKMNQENADFIVNNLSQVLKVIEKDKGEN